LQIEQRNALRKLEDDKDRLVFETVLLQVERDHLLVEVDQASHKSAVDESILREAQQQLSNVEPILREAENFGGLKRIMDQDLRVQAIGRCTTWDYNEAYTANHPFMCSM
jgi:hypothetical protein